MINKSCYRPSTINHKLILVGTNHKYSPVELRERLSFSKNRLKDALYFLKEQDILKGAIILSTCNRVEIYASASCPDAGVRELQDFLSRYHEIDRKRLSPYLYIYKGKEAVKHLFLVTCGLDSQILGEAQILGQVKHAFFEAESIGFVNEFLSEIFGRAISFAKLIHRETKISEGKISIGSVAIDFIKAKIGTLAGKNMLIIGVGKVTELVLRYLEKEKPNVVFVSNRTFEKAKELASRIGAEAVRFDKLKQFLKVADVVITATASPHFIIKKEILLDCRPQTIDHRLIILDLALPRDVDPGIKEIENVDLFYLEDLDTIIKENVEKRAEEAERAKELINIEVENLCGEFTRLEPEPALLP